MRTITQHDEYYGVPVVALSNPDEFDPSPTDPEQIYLLDIGDGMQLAFMVRATPGTNREVRVGFHAAKGQGNPDGYMFAPVQSTRAANTAFVLFADPTLTLAPRNRLSWYLGTPTVDPDDWMETIVRKVLLNSGSQYVVFEGSSAGGFVAMRMSARFANSIAVPRIPQTDIFRYEFHRPILETLQTAWRGVSYDEIMSDHFHRFRIIDLYTDPAWNRGNLIMYIQNAGDTTHTRDHLAPFLVELGSDTTAHLALDDRISVSRPYVGNGHIGIPSMYWAADTITALLRLKARVPSPHDEALSTRPHRFNPTNTAAAFRKEAVGLHYRGFSALANLP